MKRYIICFILLTILAGGVLAGGFLYAVNFRGSQQMEYSAATAESHREEIETVNNQEMIEPMMTQSSPEGNYYLVEEEGFLLVFCRDMTTLSLHTHMPITDFPIEEQEKLSQGIWFENMMEVFNYLESYSS